MSSLLLKLETFPDNFRYELSKYQIYDFSSTDLPPSIRICEFLSQTTIRYLKEHIPLQFHLSAFDRLEKDLEAKLVWLMRSAIEADYSIQLCGSIRSGQSDEYVKNTCKELLNSRYPALFKRFPVLEGLMSQFLYRWVRNIAEATTRLCDDRQILLETFDWDVHDPIVSVDSNLSDSHAGGRVVLGFTSLSGKHFLYKPRSLKMDTQFSNFVDWANGFFDEPQAVTPRTIDRGSSHGWAEFIEYKPCNSGEQLKKFYNRSGFLLGLLHILDGNDCHFENIIARDGYPILLDYETLFHSPISIGDNLTNKIGSPIDSSKLISESVFRVGYLPWWFKRPGVTAPQDLSALGAGFPDWKGTEEHPKSSPVSTQGPVPNYAHVEVWNGFEKAINIIHVHQNELKYGIHSPLRGFREVKSRVIVRPTSEYATLLERSLHLDCLSSEEKRREVLELIHVKTNSNKAVWNKLSEDEKQSLLELDIPYYSSPVKKRELILSSGEELRDVVDKSSWERVTERVSRSNEQLEFNKRIIKETLILRTRAAMDFAEPVPRASTTDKLEREVDLIAHTLEHSAFFSYSEDLTKKSLSWLTLQNLEGSKYVHQTIGPSLYDGVCGIAIFFGAHYFFTGSLNSKQICLSILGNINEHINLLIKDKVKIPCGLSEGKGSYLFTFMAIERFLDENLVESVADKIIPLWTDEAIQSDIYLDLLSGGAGDMLALVRLFEKTGDPRSIEVAKKIALHLMAKAKKLNGLSWDGIPDCSQPLTGFAHGAAGIGYAFAELGRVLGSSDYSNVARQAFEYERSVIRDGLWPDFRNTGNPAPCAWCHGGAGIGLTRLDTFDMDYEEDIHLASIEAMKMNCFGLDQICCGSLSRAELLTTAGRMLGNKDYLTAGNAIVREVVGTAQLNGGYQCLRGVPREVLVPGMFSGLAGIGYYLLRHIDPNRFPSIHLFK